MELLHDILTLRPDLRETTGSGAESGMSDIAITINPFVVILYFAWLGKPGFAIGGVLG